MDAARQKGAERAGGRANGRRSNLHAATRRCRALLHSPHRDEPPLLCGPLKSSSAASVGLTLERKRARAHQIGEPKRTGTALEAAERCNASEKEAAERNEVPGSAEAQCGCGAVQQHQAQGENHEDALVQPLDSPEELLR